MRDNKTSQAAADYDANINKTIPRYSLFLDETIHLIKISKPQPGSWLDTGCGTGNLIGKAVEHFSNVRFVAADPSAAMLEVVKEKLSSLDVTYLLAGSEELPHEASFDVVTAILAHHYLDVETRARATRNCYRALKAGGIYITFETIRPNTETGIQIGLQRWKDAQLMNGKSMDAVDKHISRYGIELLPVSVGSHLNILKEVGFAAAEIFWLSGMQAGFYGIK